jgi:hypothetical protein
LTLQAQTTSPTYSPGDQAVVNAHLTKGGQPVAGATVTMTFYLPQGPVICSVMTDANGNVTCSVGIQGNTPNGTRVDVIIGAQGSNNDSATLELSFTVRQ